MRPMLPLILWTAIVSGCATTPPPVANVRAKPVTCFLSLPPTLSLLPDNWSSMTHRDKAVTILDLHVDDGVNYAQALTQLHDCQQWIQETP